MSTPPKGKLPLPQLAEMKQRGERIVMVTAYDAPGARFAEDAGIEVVLVGDTAAMVVLGHEGTTVPVTMDEMVFLTRTRRASRATAGRDRRHAVRLVPGLRRGRRSQRDPLRQGGGRGRGQARGRRPIALTRAGDRRRGDPRDGPRRPHTAVGDDARRVQDAGQDGRGGAAAGRRRASPSRRPAASRSCSRPCPRRSRRAITQRLSVPTIGIGAGPDCDGQVLVYHDLLGLTEGHLPRFVKRYANLSREIRDALESYAHEVRSGAFPDDEHTYEMPAEELEAFSQSLLANVDWIDRSFQTDARAEPARPDGGTASGASPPIHRADT